MQGLPTWSITEDVYKGFWINRSLGSFRGPTLTLDRQAGGVVIAFLALFIAATAPSLWRIARFVMHAVGSIPARRDGFYHQRQAILRNHPLARDALLDLLRLSHVWRDRTERTYYRILPMALVAFTISVASVASGLLSSKILTNANNEVLISGRNCGAIRSEADDLASMLESVMLYQSQSAVNAFTYAMQCYRKTGASQAEQCDTFATSVLPYTADRNASCPFAKGMCKSDFGNMLLDSGALDSSVHFGLNTSPRFTLRHRTHCASLRTDGFTSITAASNATRSMQLYHYGNRYGPETNKTHLYEVEVDKKQPMFDDFAVGNYKISSLWAFGKGSGSSVELIPQLKTPNSTTSVLFLDASELLYANSTEDPWFSATTPVYGNVSSLDANNREFFVADEPVGVLGCATQRTYCNPDVSEGTGCIDGFIGMDDDGYDANVLLKAWPKAQDRSAMRGFMAALSNQGAGYLDAYYVLPSVPTLLARSTIIGNVQTAILAKDRWKDEREHLYKASLAALQSMMVEHARGLYLSGDMYCNAGDECHRICHSQKIRSSKYYSFSACTLGLIILVGGLLMLISTFIEELFALILQHPRLRENAQLKYGHAEWQAGSTLQLQRLAHENLGLGSWTRTDEAIPVTEAGDTLGVLDITNSKHARLVVPTGELETLESSSDRSANVKRTSRYSRLSSTEEL